MCGTEMKIVKEWKKFPPAHKTKCTNECVIQWKQKMKRKQRKWKLESTSSPFAVSCGSFYISRIKKKWKKEEEKPKWNKDSPFASNARSFPLKWCALYFKVIKLFIARDFFVAVSVVLFPIFLFILFLFFCCCSWNGRFVNDIIEKIINAASYA